MSRGAAPTESDFLTPRQCGFACACLFAALAAYWPGLWGPFIFDSTPTIRDNPLLRFHTFGFDEWFSAALSSDTGPLKRPLSMLSFAANAAISGLDSAFPFNLTNLLIHCVNAALVFVCVSLLYRSAPQLAQRAHREGSCWIALIAAAIFLLHPIQLPAVLHTVQRMTELSFTFVLIGVIIYVRGRIRALERGFDAETVVNTVTLVTLTTLLGGLAKENALLAPWLLMVIEVIFFQFRAGGQVNTVFRGAFVLALTLPLLIATLYLSVVHPDSMQEMYAIREFTLAERLLTQAKVLWLYLYWLVVPSAPASGLHHDDIAIARSLWEPLVAVSVIAWAAIVAVLIPACARRLPLVAFAFAWYLVAHGMESSILPLEMVYEHRNYAAILGFAVLLADALWMLFRRRPGNAFGLSLTVLVGGILLIPLAMRANLWGDEVMLAAHQLKAHPDSLRSRYHFANVHLRMADGAIAPEKQKQAILVAEHYYGRMLEIDPDDLVALVTLLYIDGKYLGGSRHGQIYTVFLAAIDKPVLLPTDYNALVFFKNCSVRRFCVTSDEEYAEVVNRLAGRPGMPQEYPALMRASYLAEARDDPERAAALLKATPSIASQQFAAHYLLARWQLQSGDLPAALDTLRAIYAKDTYHAQLTNLRRLSSSLSP